MESFMDQFNIPTERRVIERIKAVMEQNGMKMKDLNDILGWSISKISKVFSGAQNVRFSELAQICAALGYPLDAFIKEDFDLTDYERENPPMPLDAIFETYYDNYPMDDLVEEMVTQELPFAIRKLLNINWRQFGIREHTNGLNDVFSTVGRKSSMRYYSYVVITPKELHTKYEDYLEMGYFFGDDGKTVSLSIVYKPDMIRGRMKRYYNEKRFEYKPLVVGADIDIFDDKFGRVQRDDSIFHTSLPVSEICSIIYDFTNKYEAWELEKDLQHMFEVYLKLLRDIAHETELYIWDIKAKDELDSIMPAPLVCGSEKVDNATRREMDYKCDINPEHKTFIGRDGNPYVDVIRMIPLSKEGEYDANLDCVENSVCVCPNCLSQIVNGCDHDREDVLVKLFYNNRDRMAQIGLDITLTKLLAAYSD